MNNLGFGERVVLKNGILCAGTVVGFIGSEYYSLVHMKHCKDSWDKICPGWEKQPVMFVQYDTPQRYCSFEEYCSNRPEYEHSYEAYLEHVPEVMIVQMPIMGCELIP